LNTSTPATLAAGLMISAALTSGANATSVRVDTSLGDVVIDLLEEATPLTVENFLGYVKRGDYDGTVFHRSISDFIVQAGGFAVTDDDVAPTRIETASPVVNEPGISNTRGTVALAKLSGDPDSGTNQFFFNLADNSGGTAALDTQNGGFTVFGRVTDGIDVVDAIAARNTVDGGGAFTDLPYLNDTQPTGFDDVQYVFINGITVEPVVVDPIDPVDPVDPIDPIDPIDPVAPIDPVSPTNPGGPAAVPSPTAAAAGLLGLFALAARRRR